jgi:predicted kinase
MKVIITSGIPGSGKSTLIKNEFSGAEVVSADSFFTDRNGNYNFDVTKLGEAHAACMRRFIHILSNRYDTDDVLVVDNTNTTSEEIAPYYSVAKAYGASVELITLVCDPELAAERNVHGVPLAGCRAMAHRIMQRRLPPFWDMKQREIESGLFDFKGDYLE